MLRWRVDSRAESVSPSSSISTLLPMGLEDEIRAARQQRQSEQASFAQHAATTRRDVERAIEKARPDILECFQQMKRHKAAKAVSVGLAPFGAKAYILGEFAVDDKGNLLCMELRVPNRRVLSKTKSLDEFMRTRTLIMWEGKRLIPIEGVATV